MTNLLNWLVVYGRRSTTYSSLPYAPVRVTDAEARASFVLEDFRRLAEAATQSHAS